MTRPKAKRADKPQETQSWDQPSYEAGLEAAAQLVDECARNAGENGYDEADRDARDIADKIRALRRPPPTENRARKRKK